MSSPLSRPAHAQGRHSRRGPSARGRAAPAPGRSETAPCRPSLVQVLFGDGGWIPWRAPKDPPKAAMGWRRPEGRGGWRWPEGRGGWRWPEGRGGWRRPKGRGGWRWPKGRGGWRWPGGRGGWRWPGGRGGWRRPKGRGRWRRAAGLGPRGAGLPSSLAQDLRSPEGRADHGLPAAGGMSGEPPLAAAPSERASRVPQHRCGRPGGGRGAPVAASPPRGLSTSHQQRCIIAPRLSCDRPVAAHFYPHYITGIPSAALGDRCRRVVWGPRAAGRQVLGSSGLPQRRGLTKWLKSSASTSAPPTRAWR